MTDHRCTKGNRGGHGPGTHACYSLCACRCLDCAIARSDYERARARDNAQGRPLMVDAEPIRAHLRPLMADKPGAHHKTIGLKQISKVSGVSQGALWKLLYGKDGRPTRKVRRATAEKLLAVGLADMADSSTVPAGPTWRRIDEMLEAGWTKRALGRHIQGPNAATLQLSPRRVTVANARKVAALHAAWKNGELEVQGRRNPWDTRRAKETDRDVA